MLFLKESNNFIFMVNSFDVDVCLLGNLGIWNFFKLLHARQTFGFEVVLTLGMKHLLGPSDSLGTQKMKQGTVEKMKFEEERDKFCSFVFRSVSVIFFGLHIPYIVVVFTNTS